MRSYRKELAAFSLLFFSFFYIFPLALIYLEGGEFVYAGRFVSVSFYDIYWAGFLGVCFFFFYLLSLYFVFRIFFGGGNVWLTPRVSNGTLLTVKVLSLFYIVFFLLYNFFVYDNSHAYDVRRGLAAGSHLVFFLSIIYKVLGFYLVLEADSLGLKKTTVSLLLVLIFVGIFGSIGRASLLLLVAMLFFCIFKFNSSRTKIYFAGCIVALMLPFIMNMKSFIYSVGVTGTVPNVLSYYDLGLNSSSYINNFGHPVVSVLKLNELIDLVGYRFFYDYIQGIIFYLQVFGVDTGPSITYFNTEVIMGERASIIPPSHVAFGFIQFHVVGVIFSAFVWALIGLICAYIWRGFFSHSHLARFYFMFVSANTFYHGDVRIMVMTIFLPVVLIFLFRRIVYTSVGFGYK